MRRAGGVIALLVSLLVVGLVRSASLPFAEREYHVRPDADGIARAETYDVQLHSFDVADELLFQLDGGTGRLTATETFLVARLTVTPNTRSLSPIIELRTADGYTYRNVEIYQIAPVNMFHVGQSVTASFFFELPAEMIDGAWLAFGGARTDGLQAIWPVLRFDVEEPTVHEDPFEFPDDEVGPR